MGGRLAQPRGDGWRRKYWRLAVGALNSIVFFLALAMLGHWNISVWATTLQFLGALVASGGLLYAYRRATKPRPVIVRPGTAYVFRFDSSAYGTSPFRLDRTASPEDQLVQLEDFINGVLFKRFTSMNGRIDKLRDELKVARTQSESSVQKALAEIETKIEKLTTELNKSQELDLRLAIGGLFMSAIGTFLSYWA